MGKKKTADWIGNDNTNDYKITKIVGTTGVVI